MQAWVSLLTPIGTVISLIVGIVGCTIAVKSYKKSRRLEFFQRRDQVFLAISDLNAKTSEAHLIAARLGIIILNRQPLARDERFGERQKASIASMEKLQKDIELEASDWVKTIKELHSICRSFTFGKTDLTSMENLKAIVQVVSDNTKQVHEVRASTLYTLESNDAALTALKADMDNLEMQRAQLEIKMRDIPNSDKTSE